MSVYYSDDQVTLYHGDCLEIDAWLAADVLVTDPPYGTESVGWDVSYGRGQNRRHGRMDRPPGVIANDSNADARDAALLLWGDRPALVFGSPRRPEPPGDWSDRLVWDKREPGLNKGPWRYTHEAIYVRGTGWTRQSTSSFSIIRCTAGNGSAEKAWHIHHKPEPLMANLLLSAPAGTVADPFAGSGSTLVAARNLGRKAVGVEIEERYCEIIARRLDQMAIDFIDFGAPAWEADEEVASGYEVSTPGTSGDRKVCNMCDTEITGSDFNYCTYHLETCWECGNHELNCICPPRVRTPRPSGTRTRVSGDRPKVLGSSPWSTWGGDGVGP